MKLKTSCPKCDTSLSVNSDAVGKTARCPRCQSKFVIEDVRTPGSDRSLEQAVEATETIADGATPSTSGARATAASSLAIKMLGRFEIRGVLGQGGFGRVYRAYDPQLERVLALKVPTFGPQDGNKARRFQSEAKAAAQLRHPNIVPTFESGKFGNQFFIASQFIDGEPMSAITKAGRTKPEQAARWVFKVAQALGYAHEMGIVHRDVKPHNIMLDERDEPQLMDFGLAKRLNDDSGMTADGAMLGTPAYMAPEQARGDMENVGAHSDQYALGATLYELLTGQRAFDGPPHSVLTKILNEEPIAPRKLSARIPRDLEAITQKAMSKEISGRYASCDEFADDLNRWLSGDPTLARPMTPREKVTRWAKRNRSAAVALGSVLMALALVAVIGVSSAGYQAHASRQISLAADNVKAEQVKTLEALQTATQEKDRAEKEKQAAEEQKRIAEQQSQLAQTQKTLAEKHQSEAEHERELAQQAAEANRRIAYSAQMNLGQQTWDQGNIGFLHDLLDRYFPQPEQTDLRSFEWYYWWRESHGYRRRIAVDGGNVSVVAVSPDSKTLATASDDLVIRLWDIETGEIRHSLRGHTREIFCMAFTSDGKTLASGGGDALIRLWDLAGNHEMANFPHSGTATVAVFSRDSRTLATCSTDQNVRLWDLASRKVKKTFSAPSAGGERGGCRCLTFSPDDRFLVAPAENGGLNLWDLATGDLKSKLSGLKEYTYCLAFSPDGTTLATGSRDGLVRRWFTATDADVQAQRLLRAK